MAPQKAHSMIYSFVARRTTVLVEYTSFTGNFSTIAQQCLEKLPAENNKFTFPHGGHTLNYLIENGYAYMLLCEESVPREIAFSFLDRVRDEFVAKCGAKANAAPALGLNKEFSSALKVQMKFAEEHPEELSKVARIQAQVQEVKGVMKDNIQQVLQRGEKLETLTEKTDDLRAQASEFQKSSKEIKTKFWYQNLRAKIVIIVLLIIVGLVIWLSICKGFTCQ